jgi:hypothetical protein
LLQLSHEEALSLTRLRKFANVMKTQKTIARRTKQWELREERM